MIGTLESLRDFIKVLRRVDEGGTIYGTGAFLKGDVLTHPAYQQIYEMGKSL